MASILIKDLEVNEDLDQKALENLRGGRWVRRRFTSMYYKRYTRTIRRRVVSYRYYRQTYTRLVRRTYVKLVWV